MKKIVVGTRKSKLALVQTKMVINQIKEVYKDIDFEVKKFVTKGDLILDKSLNKVGGKGLFIKELELALLNGEIDMAVHSMKDVPYLIHDELKISAVTKREDPKDVLVTKNGEDLKSLKKNALIGTSSLRREVQIKNLRKDIVVKSLRGNVITRLERLNRGDFDGIILAAAGLIRLKVDCKFREFRRSDLVPSAGQGIMGIETRKDFDDSIIKSSLNDEKSEIEIKVERDFMERLKANCSTPVGINAAVVGGYVEVYCILAPENKTFIVKHYKKESIEKTDNLGLEMADKILEKFNLKSKEV